MLNFSEKEELYELLLLKRKKQLISSFHEFVKEAFEQLHVGKPFKDNWHIKYICFVLQREMERLMRGEKKTKDIIINVPPRSLKSFIVSVCLQPWVWSIDSTIKFIGSSYAESLSMEHNMQSRRIVESDWYRTFFPHVKILKDNNTKGLYENDQHGVRQCTSTNGAITGKGAHVIFIDDPQDPRRSRSEIERINAIRNYDESLSTRMDDPEIGVYIIIMQRLHALDLTGHCLSKQPDRYFHICIPSNPSRFITPAWLKLNYKNNSFFDKRFSEERLKQLKIALGSYGYAGQFSQRPADEEGGILKKNWFNIISWQEFEYLIQSTKAKKPVWNFKADTAYTDDDKNDPSAIMAFTWFKGNLYIRKTIAERLEFPELIKRLEIFCRSNGYTHNSRVGVEPKASGKSVVQQLKKQSELNIVEDEPPTDDKITRVNSISPIVESGKVFCIEGDWVESFIEEVTTFPNAAHDDKTDCLVQAINSKPKFIKA